MIFNFKEVGEGKADGPPLTCQTRSHIHSRVPYGQSIPHPLGFTWSPAAKMSSLEKTIGDSDQSPVRSDGVGPKEKFTQGCTNPQPVRQRHLLSSLSIIVSHQAWVLGRMRVLSSKPASLCEETGHAEPPMQRTSMNEYVCVCVSGAQGSSIRRSLLRGQRG